MNTEITDVNALRITALTEVFLYGIYITIFYQSLRVLYTKQQQNIRTGHLYLIIIMLFIFSTLNISTTLVCNFSALESKGSNGLQFTGACVEFASLSKMFGYSNVPTSWISILKAVLLVTAVLLSDSFLVFRCYLVWNKRYEVVLFPTVILVIDIPCGIFYTYLMGANQGIVNPGSYGIPLVIFILISLLLNVCCTFLIAHRIWKMQKQLNTCQDRVSSPRSSYMSHAIVTVIESGAIYTGWVLVTMIFIFLGVFLSFNGSETPSYVCQSTMVQIIGITFSLIISRIGQGVSIGDSQAEQTHMPVQSNSIHFRTGLSHTESIEISIGS